MTYLFVVQKGIHFKDTRILHTVSSEVFRSLSEYEFAAFYFDEKTCETAMQIF